MEYDHTTDTGIFSEEDRRVLSLPMWEAPEEVPGSKLPIYRMAVGAVISKGERTLQKLISHELEVGKLGLRDEADFIKASTDIDPALRLAQELERVVEVRDLEMNFNQSPDAS